MVTPIDTKRMIDPPRLGERHEVHSMVPGVGPSRQTGELDGVIGPTRPFGELDCSSDSEIHFSRLFCFEKFCRELCWESFCTAKQLFDVEFEITILTPIGVKIGNDEINVEKFPRNLSKRKIRIRKTKTLYCYDYYTTSPSQGIDQTIKWKVPEHRNNRTNAVRPSRSLISQGQLAQRRVGQTDPTRRWASWTNHSSLGELDEPLSNRVTASWINQVQLSVGRVGSVMSGFAFAELDQSRTFQFCLRNSPLLVSVELSLVSSRLELSLKLYRQYNKNLFSRISSD